MTQGDTHASLLHIVPKEEPKTTQVPPIPPAPSGREIDRVWHWASAICQMSVLPCSDLQAANGGSVRR